LHSMLIPGIIRHTRRSLKKLSRTYASSVRTNQDPWIINFLKGCIETYILDGINCNKGTEYVLNILSAAAHNGDVETLDLLFAQQLFLTANKIEIFMDTDIMLRLIGIAGKNGHHLFFEQCITLLINHPQLSLDQLDSIFFAFSETSDLDSLRFLTYLASFIGNPACSAFVNASYFQIPIYEALTMAVHTGNEHTTHYLLTKSPYKELIDPAAIQEVIQRNRRKPTQQAMINKLLHLADTKNVSGSRESKKCVVM
jgi:hypothetical protein